MKPDEIEMAFIIEFSHARHGAIGADPNRDSRAERIRVAIWREDKVRALFRDSGMTYATAYRKAFNLSVDARKHPRGVDGLVAIPDDETETDEVME